MSLWIIAAICLIGLASFQYSEAIQNTDHVTVRLSDTCLINHYNNFSTSCPTYEDLLEVFTDTSDKSKSGDFAYNEFGFLERQPSPMQSHTEFYRYHENITYWIDPPADLLLAGAKKIVIQPADFVYPIRQQTLNDTSFEIGENRYVSPNCVFAIVTATNWLFLVGDTMRLMANNCDPEYTFFNDTKTISWVATQHDITTSKKWQYEQLIKETKIKCSVRCNEYDTVGQDMGKIAGGFGTNHTITLQETLHFSDDYTYDPLYVAMQKPNPCDYDKTSPMCELYKYKIKNHPVNTDDPIKIRNNMAGAIGEFPDEN